MRLAIFFTFIGAAIGAEAVQFIDASILTSLIPVLLILISLYFLLAPPTRESSHGKQKISDAMFALTVGGSVGFYDGFFGLALALSLPFALWRLDISHWWMQPRVPRC